MNDKAFGQKLKETINYQSGKYVYVNIEMDYAYFLLYQWYIEILLS